MNEFQQNSSQDINILPSIAIGIIAAAIGIFAGILVFRLENPFLALAGAIALLFALITVTNVEFGLLALVFMVYTRASDVFVQFHGTPSILKPYIALMVVAIFVKWFVERRVPGGWGRAAILISAYGMVVFSSLLYASDFSYAWGAVLNFFKDGIIAVVLAILLRSGKTLKGVVWTLIAVGVFVGTISAYQGLTGTYDNDFWGFGQVGFQNIVGETEGNRLSGPVGDPNFYAQSMLVLIPIALNRFLKEKRWFLKALGGWAFVVTTLAVVFSYSRGAAVAAILMLLFGVFHTPPRLTDVLIGVLLVVIIVGFVPNPYVARLSTITDIFSGRQGVVSDVSYRGRASEIISAWLMFIDYPILGVGVENYPVYYQEYSRRLGLDPRIEERQAHSLYLQVAAETGLAGILVFGTLLVFMMRGMLDAWKKLKEEDFQQYADMVLSLATGVVGYLSAALFIHAAYPRYFWLLAGIALAIPRVAQNIIRDEEPELNAYNF